MCYDAFRNVEGTSPRQIIYGYLAAVIFLLACEKFVESEDFDTGIEVLTLVFVTIYGVLLYLYRKMCIRDRHSLIWMPPPFCPVRSWSRVFTQLWILWNPPPVFWKRMW